MYIGIDIGSISVKIAVLSEEKTILHSDYLYHRGNPVEAVSRLLHGACERGLNRYMAMCTTGSGRNIIGKMIGADLIKNEITASWKAVATICPEVRTFMEIGGQDSKLILLKDGEITDFKLNSVCAAGTGSFIEQQANRLGVTLSTLSNLALEADDTAKFTGRCTVFVETEMINLQQRGYPAESIAAGLFEAICENYLGDLGAGVNLEKPVLFCGGVSEIAALRRAFEKKLGTKIIVPPENRIAAAYGASLIAAEAFAGGDISDRGHKELPVDLINAAPFKMAQCSKTDCLSCGICFKNKPS